MECKGCVGGHISGDGTRWVNVVAGVISARLDEPTHVTSGIVMQVGTAVVTRQDKRLAVGRLGALVEQIEALVSKDLQVILVSRIVFLRRVLPHGQGAGPGQKQLHLLRNLSRLA